MKPKIKYVNYGLANCFDNDKEKWIEMNKNLKKYPKLHDSILKHELKHFYSKNRFDFMIELKDMLDFKKQREISKFVHKYPGANTQLLPFVWNRKGFFPDYFMLGFYLVFILIFIIFIKLVI